MTGSLVAISLLLFLLFVVLLVVLLAVILLVVILIAVIVFVILLVVFIIIRVRENARVEVMLPKGVGYVDGGDLSAAQGQHLAAGFREKVGHVNEELIGVLRNGIVREDGARLFK